MTELTEEMRKDGALDTITISRADARALILYRQFGNDDIGLALDAAIRIESQLEGKA